MQAFFYKGAFHELQNLFKVSTINKKQILVGWVEQGRQSIPVLKTVFLGRLSRETQHFHQPMCDEALGFTAYGARTHVLAGSRSIFQSRPSRGKFRLRRNRCKTERNR